MKNIFNIIKKFIDDNAILTLEDLRSFHGDCSCINGEHRCKFNKNN